MDFGRTLPADVGLAETLTHLVTEALVRADANGCVVWFNPAAERMLGYTSGSVSGKALRALLHGSNLDDPLVATRPLEPLALNLVFRNTQDVPVHVRARSTMLRQDDRPAGWIVAFHPSGRVSEIEQLKTELVSSISHELKTPLSAIKAYTATLRQNPALYEAHRDEFLAVVEQQADRLSRLVDDMLLVSRVETEQLLRRRVRVPVGRILDDALGEVRVDPVTHPIAREVDGVEVSGDPDRLRDVLRNLIENAVKYSPQGGAITVEARVLDATTQIDVRDLGIGIAEEHVPYIFDRFFRVDSEASASAGGSGLGLYIVNALVRAHGGTVHVHSRPRAGTTFTLRLPLR